MGDIVTVRIATDQTGALPVVSSQGNWYVFILYYYNRNTILEETMNSRKGGEILRAYRNFPTST